MDTHKLVAGVCNVSLPTVCFVAFQARVSAKGSMLWGLCSLPPAFCQRFHAFFFLFVQDAAARSLFSTKSNPTKRGDGFNMGDRDSILDAVEAGPILVHVALAEGNQFPYEAIMRSVFKHLMDSATSEYLFTIEFFKVGSGFPAPIPRLYS